MPHRDPGVIEDELVSARWELESAEDAVLELEQELMEAEDAEQEEDEEEG